MSKICVPGPETDAIIDRQVASGKYATGEDVVRASVQLLEDQEAELEELRKLIDEDDAAYAAGEYVTYSSADELIRDIIERAEARSKSKA
jgi:putative addiction module CopG family antidote